MQAISTGRQRWLPTLGALTLLCSSAYAADPLSQDARIRAVVEEVLRAKQTQIEGLEARVRELEARIAAQAATIDTLSQAGNQPDATVQTALAEASERIEVLERHVADAEGKPVDETGAEASNGLEISGFFDMTARTENAEDKTFDFGDFELDLEYAFDEHFSVSSALVWGGDAAEVAVAVVDYHVFNDHVPARGRIFQEPGFHLQLGRFDVPFGVDYQYFAAPDRPNVTAPLTTERVLQGGFNSDGVRAYSTWGNFDLAVFWTESLYASTGTGVGTRVGFFPGRNPYRLHRFGGDRPLELGLSYALDLDADGDTRDRVYGADLTFSYGMFQLIAEAMVRDGLRDVVDGNDESLGERDESAYYVALVADLQGLVKHPVYVFGRYERWDPDFDFVLDEDDGTVRFGVEATPRLTLGVGYDISDYIRIKLEYFNHLGGDTEEPGFDDTLGLAQLAASF